MIKEFECESWEAFDAKVREQRAKTRLLFRGLADATWPLSTTLERYGSGDRHFWRYYQVVAASHSEVQAFGTKTWDDLDDYREVMEAVTDLHSLSTWIIEKGFPGMAYLAFLRQHGFPSPLMDWTRSPYIAAFFAFRSPVAPPSGRVAIVAYCETLDAMRVSWGPVEPIIRVAPRGRTHRRHYLQQGEYTVCLAENDRKEIIFGSHETILAAADGRRSERQNLLYRFLLPWSERLKVLTQLDDYNVNAFSLFESDEALAETVAARRILIEPARMEAFSRAWGETRVRDSEATEPIASIDRGERNA